MLEFTVSKISVFGMPKWHGDVKYENRKKLQCRITTTMAESREVSGSMTIYTDNFESYDDLWIWTMTGIYA